MSKQQLEEDRWRNKGPHQFSSCQALVVGTGKKREMKQTKGSVKGG